MATRLIEESLSSTRDPTTTRVKAATAIAKLKDERLAEEVRRAFAKRNGVQQAAIQTEKGRKERRQVQGVANALACVQRRPQGQIA